MKNNSGFAALEALLILIIVTIIGGTGWYVLKSKNNANTTLTNSQNITQPTNLQKKKSLTLQKWAVAGTYASSLDLTYKLTTSPVDGAPEAQISSKQLDQSGANCTYGSGGIVRYGTLGDYQKAVSTSSDLGNYRKVGNYYYAILNNSVGCANPDKVGDLQTEAATAIQQVLKSLQPN